MSITKSGPLTVVAGGAVAYQLTVANAGPAAATGLSVVDTLPAGVTFVSASGTGLGVYERGERVGDLHAGLASPSGASAPVITVNVTAQAQAGTMVNSAAVTATTPDPVPANNTATASTTGHGPRRPRHHEDRTSDGHGWRQRHLLAGRAEPRPLGRGLVERDRHAARRCDVRVGRRRRVGLYERGQRVRDLHAALLATGTTAPAISVVVTGPAQGATLSNSATVSSTTPDPVAGNNTSSVSTGVTASADLSMVKSGPATVVAGGSVSYSLWWPMGSVGCGAVCVVDTLPAGVTFVSASGSGGRARTRGMFGDVYSGDVCDGCVDDDRDRGDGAGAGDDVEQHSCGVVDDC